MTTNTEKKFNIPKIETKDLIDAGVHFGHRISARNPKMKPFIYGEASGVHIMDLRKTYFYLDQALKALYEYSSQGKRILFVSTDQKWYDLLKEVAMKSGQYYIGKWRGGMLTNWRTIVSSIKTLKKYNSILETVQNDVDSEKEVKYTKKEILKMTVRRDKLDKCFGGITEMGGMPDLIIILSLKNEKLVIDESICVGIPILGIADTNSDPSRIAYPIPGNDDSFKAMNFYTDLFTQSILAGTEDWLSGSGAKKASKEESSDEKSSSRKEKPRGSYNKKDSLKPKNNKKADFDKDKKKGDFSKGFRGPKKRISDATKAAILQQNKSEDKKVDSVDSKVAKEDK